MKKTATTFLMSGLLFVTGLKAQSIQEGMNHLYAGRYKSAINLFEKLLAVNPNNIEATYWLGQTYMEGEEIHATRISNAKQLYEKALLSSNGAPLIQVGMGHVELLEGKMNEARQHFETALTMTRGRKGDDPVIETAIGRAIADSKNGDYKYAVKLLEDAASKEPKNTETLLQLGNAYRKAGEGSGGGQAYLSYNKALAVNPAFAPASFRLAQLFRSQVNHDLVLQYLHDAIAKDPKFSNAYYELFYYYFFKLKYAEAEEQIKKYIDSKAPELDIQDQYLYAQLLWAKKDYDASIIKSEGVVAAMGDKTKPKVYRLLAETYLNKSDYKNAKKYSDLFFAKKNPDDIILPDYERKALIDGKLGASPDEVYNTYISALTIDTTLDVKLGYLKKGAIYFKENKIFDKQALIGMKIIEMKPKPIINDYFDVTLAHYFDSNYVKSREVSLIMREKFTDQVYGYEWAFNNSTAVDTIKQDSIAVPDAISLYTFSLTDSVKYKKQYISTVRYLAAYFINKAKDKDKSLEYFRKWQSVDTVNAAMIQGYIEQIEKMPNVKPGTKPTNTSPKSTGKKTSAPAKTSKTKKTTVATKKSVVKR